MYSESKNAIEKLVAYLESLSQESVFGHEETIWPLSILKVTLVWTLFAASVQNSNIN